MRHIRMRMTPPQAEFFQLNAKFPLFVAGYGAGKTETLLNCALRDALEAPRALIALYEPTYDLVRLILAPRLEEKLAEHGIAYTYNKSENVVRCHGQCGSFVLRTLDNPARIVGYESYRAHVDEIDTLSRDKALDVWRKIIARNRQKPAFNGKNRVCAYTTPEGYRFAYETWQKAPAEGYQLVRASTYSNPFLPADYIPGLLATYPPQLVKAYIEGLFVNLTSGSVYPDFDRHLNNAATAIERPTANQPGEPLHVGMDFNVNQMAAVVFVVRDNAPHAVAELTGVRDTPTMIRLLQERYAGHTITVYPDASGQHSSSQNASLSDLTFLTAAGFGIIAGRSNPPVKDRVASVNAQILNAKGERRLKVNTASCPRLTDALEQQAYDKHGEPDKDQAKGLDHPNDATGYFIYARWPAVRTVHSHRTSVLHMER